MIKTLLAAAATFAVATSAQAVVTFSSTAFDVAPGPNETVVLDFESTTAPAGYTFSGSGFQFLTGSSGAGAAPFGDATQYLSVLGGGSFTITFPVALDSFSLYIGSIDDYNSIEFTTSTGTEILTGIDLTATPNGDQNDAATNRRYFFTAGAGQTISSVTFTSGQNSFEFDNLATSAIPEASTWALMIAGFGMVGFAARRRRGIAAIAA